MNTKRFVKTSLVSFGLMVSSVIISPILFLSFGRTIGDLINPHPHCNYYLVCNCNEAPTLTLFQAIIYEIIFVALLTWLLYFLLRKFNFNKRELTISLTILTLVNIAVLTWIGSALYLPPVC